MKKIPSLFERDFSVRTDGGHKVVDKVNPASSWVAEGQGVGTRKRDGMAVLWRGGQLFKRYDAKAGREPPEGFEPAQPAADPETGHWPGWIPTVKGSKADAPLWEAVDGLVAAGGAMADGSYEVCGPKIGTRHGANPEKLDRHVLFTHGGENLGAVPRSYAELRDWLDERPEMEGVVWRHPDGRMAKIKRNDFPPRAPRPGTAPKP